jgi:hypothetical protein
MAFVEGQGEEDVRGFRAAIGDEGIVGGPLKVGVFKVNVRVAVTGGREVDKASAVAEERCDAVDEDEVAEVVGAELRLKAVGGVSKGRCHYAGVGDDDVEGFAFAEQGVGRGAHTLEVGKVEFEKLKASAICCGVPAYLSSRRLRLCQVARRADNVRAMRGKRARGLHAEAGRDAGYENPFAMEVYAGEDLLGR